MSVIRQIKFDNKISTDNSDTNAINNGSNFTGTWEDVLLYDSIIVAVKTDQNGYYEVQFSPDATNVDSTLTKYYRTSNIEPPHRYTVTRRYFRIIFYNNSGSNQTYFRLQTTLGYKTPLNIPIDAVMSQDYDSISTRPTNFNYEVALGLREGNSTWNKWGYNPDVDTGSPETIWSIGGALTPLTSAETFDIAYDGTAGGSTDGAGTNGATKLGFWYVDSNRIPQYSEHTLGTDGTDTTSFSGIGINRVKVVEAGSGRVNASAITITATTATTNQAHIPAGEGITQQAFFFTGANRKSLLDWIHFDVVKISAGNQPVVTVKAWLRDYANNVDSEIFREVMDTSVENNIAFNPKHPFIIPEKSLLEFTAETDIDNTVVSIRFSLIEVEDIDS